MIRLKPFDRISYQELREAYINRLIKANAIAPELQNILKGATAGKKAKNTIPQPLATFLNKEGELGLRLLLIGPEPEDMPESFGGCRGKYATMRQVFEKIINTIGKPRRQSEEAEYKKLFRYSQLSRINKSNPEKISYWLQRQLQVPVCPFCNRIYTTTLFRESVRPAFDHFFPRSEYPYLAVSLFNLIPICDICNKAKSDRIDSIIYPYDESFDECFESNLPVHAAFRVIPNGDQPWNVFRGQSEAFTIQFQPTNDAGETLEGSRCGMITSVDVQERFSMKGPAYWNRITNSICVLKLEDLYDTHKNEIIRILRNRYQYNRVAITSILKPLLNGENPYASDAVLILEAQNMLYFANLDPEDWGITPLNKLKADILKQMDIIEMASSDIIEPLREDEEHGERRYFSAAGAVAGV
ncbi:hypothetical protein [uncultured Oscillibacter sp.]|jgi:hypothetical protein|uniref:hypothetical protein n=1 Tax=uncultured Oscillibacter sp. TaxID=876091 RepID=UPI00260EBEC3|nr:hypothetical protein [uncultured Oscillibacter sp.]